MALTQIQQNILSRIQKLSQTELDAKNEATALIGMWGNEFGTLPTLADLQAYPPFAHITPTELSDGAGALLAINSTRGEFNVTGSNVVKLLKIVNGAK